MDPPFLLTIKKINFLNHSQTASNFNLAKQGYLINKLWSLSPKIKKKKKAAKISGKKLEQASKKRAFPEKRALSSKVDTEI